MTDLGSICVLHCCKTTRVWKVWKPELSWISTRNRSDKRKTWKGEINKINGYSLADESYCAGWKLQVSFIFKPINTLRQSPDISQVDAALFSPINPFIFYSALDLSIKGGSHCFCIWHNILSSSISPLKMLIYFILHEHTKDYNKFNFNIRHWGLLWFSSIIR